MIRLLLKAPARFAKSFGYAWNGLKAAFVKEESFRLETIALAALIAVMIPWPWPLWKKFALVGAYLLVPFAELVNSAIEDVCDLASPGPNDLVKTAKDKGAMAVLAAIILVAVVLVALILA